MSKNKNKIKYRTIEQLKKDSVPIYALIYCRVSSEKQVKEGNGLESQEQRCKEFAKHNGYIVEEKAIFKDAASGGGSYTSRPGQVELLEFIDKYPHKSFVVIIDDISRFARDVQAHFQLKLILKARGVELASPNFNFDDTLDGELLEGISAMFSQHHRKSNARQVIQKQKARLELGYWAFGSKKGYKMTRSDEHGTISIPIENESKILKEALEGFANGTFVRKINVCEFLVEKGFWKKQSPEKYIDKLENNILRDPFYAGLIEYPDWEVSRRIGKHKGLISIETFELIQKRLQKGDLSKRIRKDTSDDFPLRGLLVCADCESHITAAWCKGRNIKHPYYYCQKKGCISRNKMVRKDIIESQFTKLLKDNPLKKDVSKILQAVFDKVWKDEIVKIRKSLNDLKFTKTDLETKSSEFMDRIPSAKTETMKRAYEDKIESLRKEIENINSNMPAENLDLDIPYKTAIDKAMGLIKSPYVIWATLNTQEKQSLFYFIFERKLKYSKKYGYQTDKIPSAVMLFEEFSALKTPYVEMGEIESPCRRLL